MKHYWVKGNEEIKKMYRRHTWEDSILLGRKIFPYCSINSWQPQSKYKWITMEVNMLILLTQTIQNCEILLFWSIKKSIFIQFACLLSHSVMSDSLQPHDYSPHQAPLHGDSPGKNTEVGCLALLQGIFPTQGSNSGLLHYRQIL